MSAVVVTASTYFTCRSVVTGASSTNDGVDNVYCLMLQDSNKPEAHVTSYKVYVTGVKEGVDEHDLREYFSQFGSIESVDIVVDRETQKPRGFAFVSFSDYDPVDKIVCKFSCCFVHSQHLMTFTCMPAKHGVAGGARYHLWSCPSVSMCNN